MNDNILKTEEYNNKTIEKKLGKKFIKTLILKLNIQIVYNLIF
jgi:hypothetical protein